MNVKIKLLLLPLLVFASLMVHGQWINEIHYDNAGGDVNEGIEIAAPAGTDLTCYDLVLYNGNDNLMYATINLSGTISDQGCGYGTLWFAYAGIQNGSPDGIALVNTCTATVVQFLSYEGVMTAGDGPATGMSSTDIGVSEGSGTATNESLQLTGTGTNYGDFTWQSPSTSSNAAINPGQDFCVSSNTITVDAVNTTPFNVDCQAATDDNGTVDFTSVGTFNGGNIYTVQLSDETGSFASPTTIGTLSSTANSGTINITIPASTNAGASFAIRIISSDPATTSDTSAAFTIIQGNPCVQAIAQGLIINEWSNGTTGQEEYYEFVVAGECGTSIDIRNYILDDNNGTFTNPADYDATASGIAPGHFRFTNDAQWASIPVGSLIVVYNADEPNPELPADDPTDADNDSLYVVPHNSSLFEYCTTMPTSASPDSIYTPCSYGTAPLSGWGPLSLRNGGDAIQVRNPDGSYYHGVSYGGSEMTGGPHDLKLFTSSGSGMCGWFNDDDFFDAANWSSGAANGTTQTPGEPNNPVNYAWLKLMRDPAGINCPITVLPVELVSFEGFISEHGNVLLWTTITELNSNQFFIERSSNGKNWERLGAIPAAGNSQIEQNYQFVDISFEETINYYRLTQIDQDGTLNNFNHIVVLDNRAYSENNIIGRYNLMGQEIDANYSGVQILLYEDGTTERIFKR